MKCSQCGGNDLIKVDFPQKVNLIEDGCGLAGYASSYHIKNKIYCDSYLCVSCGHYEFFNLKLAEQIKADRKIEEETKDDINKIKNDIVELNAKVVNIKNQIEKLKTESLNLDITVRRSHEIQETISNLKTDIKSINKAISEKEKELIRLEKVLSDVSY